MMDMSSSGKEHADDVILEKGNQNCEVQSMKRYGIAWLWAGGWWQGVEREMWVGARLRNQNFSQSKPTDIAECSLTMKSIY